MRRLLRWRTAAAAAAFLLLGVAAIGQSGRQRVDILVGFFAEDSPQSSTRERIDTPDRIFMLETLRAPIDRQAVRNAPILYVDRFPPGVELFRDDMEAFHFMVHRGGVLVLVCGGEAHADAVANFNYLGTRFDFQFQPARSRGVIAPEIPRAGPLGGDVWICERGVRPIVLDHPDWRVHFREPESGLPAAASRRIGSGLLFLIGTDEVNRTSEGVAHSAVTLIEWCREALRQRPAPPPAPTPAPRWAVPRGPLEPEEALRIASASEAIDLRGRMAEWAAIAGEDESRWRRPLGGERLIPEERRTALPSTRALRTLEGRSVQLADFRNRPLVIDFIASWDPKSRRKIRDRVELARGLSPGKAAFLAIAIDKSPSDLRALLVDEGVDWHVAIDERGFHSPNLALFGVEGPGRTLVLDKRGRVAARDVDSPDLPLILYLLDRE